ncbi:DUF5681 domain-containing protein [Roseiarcus sp.]|uniref:DUF5681 domain-containing protein n=1 Tax=Roseiarcus sp. TaxID=1969460 RepID=UPI003C78BAC8
MPRGGPRSTSFKPGVSGNPGGRPKRPQTIAARRIVADVKGLARESAPEAILTLKEIMLDVKAPPAARIGAATAILDRGFGRPGQAVDIAVVHDLTRLTDQQLEELEHLVAMIELPSLAQGQELEDPP